LSEVVEAMTSVKDFENVSIPHYELKIKQLECNRKKKAS
jgi:hypothetical protein